MAEQATTLRERTTQTAKGLADVTDRIRGAVLATDAAIFGQKPTDTDKSAGPSYGDSIEGDVARIEDALRGLQRTADYAAELLRRIEAAGPQAGTAYVGNARSA